MLVHHTCRMRVLACSRLSPTAHGRAACDVTVKNNEQTGAGTHPPAAVRVRRLSPGAAVVCHARAPRPIGL
jgi:hypothetical protein